MKWYFHDSTVELGKKRLYHVHGSMKSISSIGHAQMLYDGSIQCDKCHLDVPEAVLDVALLYGNVSFKQILC